MGCRHSLLCSPGIGDEGLQGAQLPSHGMQQRQEAGSHRCHSERRETNLAAPVSQEGPLVNPHSATTCPVLMALLPRRCPDADVRGVFTPGGGKAPRRQLQVRTACLPPPLPLLLLPRKLPSPHSFSSHLLCSLPRALIRQLGRGKGGASLSAGILSAWQYFRHFCVVDSSGSLSLTEVTKP